MGVESGGVPEQVSFRQKITETRAFRKSFKEEFKQGEKTVPVPDLNRRVSMVSVGPFGDIAPSGEHRIVVPGWTEDIHVLKPLIRAWAKKGDQVSSFTPGKLLNPDRDDYPEDINERVRLMVEKHSRSENGKEALKALMGSRFFNFHFQKALELVAVMKDNPNAKNKLHAHSQGLPVAIIASLLNPELVDSILGDAGAGTVGGEKTGKLASRFVVHLTGSTARSFTRPKDAYRITRGGIGAGKYVAQNLPHILREGGVIAGTDVYPALEYLQEELGIPSALIVPSKDRLFTRRKVDKAHSEHMEETGHAVSIHGVKGSHNEAYIRAETQVDIASQVWDEMRR